jgi:hypothetical protein
MGIGKGKLLIRTKALGMGKKKCEWMGLMEITRTNFVKLVIFKNPYQGYKILTLN